jgi:hypothetical protein
MGVDESRDDDGAGEIHDAVRLRRLSETNTLHVAVIDQ